MEKLFSRRSPELLISPEDNGNGSQGRTDLSVTEQKGVLLGNILPLISGNIYCSNAKFHQNIDFED